MSKAFWNSLWVWFLVLISSLLGHYFTASYVAGGLPVAAACVYYAIVSNKPFVGPEQHLKAVNTVKIKDLIKGIRAENGLNQDELGNKLNVSRRTVRRWEKGIASPSIDDIINICVKFNLSLNEVMKNYYSDYNNLE